MATRGVLSDNALPPRVKASAAIIHAIRVDIASGTLAEGTKLPTEKTLAAHFGVSQPTVREAVRALEVMGLVESRHGSGVYVRASTQDFVSSSLELLLQLQDVHILEVFDVRRALGSHSAILACQHATDEDIDYMEQCLQRLHDASSAQGIAEAVVDFQAAFSAAARNPLLTTLETFLMRITMQFQLLAYRDNDVSWWKAHAGEFEPDRLAVVTALRAHDADNVLATWSSYLDAAYERFVRDPVLSQIRLSDQAAIQAVEDIVLKASPPIRPSRTRASRD